MAERAAMPKGCIGKSLAARHAAVQEAASEEDSDIYDEDNMESVFDLEGVSDSDDDDVDDDAEDDDEAEEEAKHAKDTDRAWGTRRAAFYDGDEVASDDEEGEKMMRKEVKRLQAEKYASMDASDFADDSLGALAKKGSKARGKKTSSASAEEVEVVERDLEGMSDADLVAVVRRQAPELLDLLGDFKAKIADVRGNVAPLLDQIKAGVLPTSRGISFLDVKYRTSRILWCIFRPLTLCAPFLLFPELLLTYCMNLAFYFYLKASGQRIKDHPVVSQLVELRAYIEKLRPLEAKFKYQIDKLAKAATADGSAAQSASAAAAVAHDPLRFRPNFASMVSDEPAASTSTAPSDGLYKPTRIAPVHFDEESTSVKQQRRAARLLGDTSRKGRLLRDLQAEFSERPELIAGARDDGADEDDPAALRDRERTRYEEENFVRLTVSKSERNRRAKGQELTNDLADLDDFGDFDAFVGAATGAAKEKRDEFEELRKRPRRDQARTERASRLQDDDGEGDEDAADALAYYEGVRDAKKRRRDDREEVAGDRRRARAQEEEAAFEAEEGDSDGDGKRAASKDMLKNRGLTPHRNKSIKNPRVKRRMRFEQAKIKLKSSGVRTATAPKTAYGGEATGIKSKLSRSVRIK